jgi:alanine dehydrogenase
MHNEGGERRDFLPDLIGGLARLGCEVFVESGIGSAMGYVDSDYLAANPERVHVIDEREAYAQDVVVVLRSPNDRFEWIRPGATLISMLHFPTRPVRVQTLVDLGIDAVSLDSIEDDAGRRLVVNATAVAWNGLEAAFDVLERAWPHLASRRPDPVHVAIMGAGDIGKHAVEAATKYGSVCRADRLGRRGVRGVEVTTIGRNLTFDAAYMLRRLAVSDVLVDATQRDDPSIPIVRNAWLGAMPEHGVVCDLVVDPYLLDESPPTVRAIEGIPQGNLDRYVFEVDDPGWDAVPPPIPTLQRRTVVSCYSWPGAHPRRCMELYGRQLLPLLETFVTRGGVPGLRPDGDANERALYRGTLRARLATTRVEALSGV